MDSLEYLDNNYQEPCDTSTISSNSIPLPSPTYTPSIISKNSISLSKSNTSSDISYDNLNNSIVKDHDLFLSSSPSSLDDISNDDISLEDSFQEIKEKKKKDDVLLESSLPIVQYQAKTPQPIEKPNVITINSVINNNNNNNGKKDNANHTGKGIINNKLPSTSSNKKDSASVRFNFNNNLDIKNYSESDDDIERIEKNSIEFLTNEHGFIKTFINLSLDECDECNPVERKIAEKLLDKQLPLLKNYENTILSIETFMDKIIEDLKKYKSRENDFISNIDFLKNELQKSNDINSELDSKLKKSNDINTELDSKLKKSNDINTELDQNYQNLKEYSNSIMRENADLQQIIEKCRNYIEQLEKSDKDNSNKVKRDEEDYVKEIERRMNEERVKIIKEERERLIREESRKINEEEREKIRKEERNKLNDIYEKLKGEEIENLKRELDVLREEKESAIKREREKLKMVRNERIMAETEKIKQEELELINMERDKMRRESKERLREEMEKLREEEMKILNEEREKLKAGEMQILNVEREKLKEEEMKILNEEREKLKNDEIIILNRERERIRSEEREKIRKEEKERFKKKERLRKEMEKERNIITGKNKMKEAESEDNSNANDNSNNIKLTSTDHLPDKEENYLTDIDIIEQDISNIFSSTSNTIQKAILMYDYLFKENLKPYDSYSNNEMDELKKLKRIYKNITKKFQISMKEEIKMIVTLRERYSEKIEEQKQVLIKMQQQENELLKNYNSEQNILLKKQQINHQQQLKQIIHQLKKEFTDLQNSSPKKWTEAEFLSKLESLIEEYNNMRDNPNENLIACELKLLQKSYYIINKEIKDDLENCIHFLNSINESENETNIQNITVIFPSLKKLYQEVKGLNRLIKINEDLYNSDKNDSQQIIDNKIECINKLQEELTDTKNTLMETEEKCNKLINEKQKVLKELENTTSQVEILEENINKKKEDLKEFLSEHNTLVNLYNTVVEEEKKKYKMLEQDYNFLRNIQMEYQKKIKNLESENCTLNYELDSIKRNTKLKKHHSTYNP